MTRIAATASLCQRPGRRQRRWACYGGGKAVVGRVAAVGGILQLPPVPAGQGGSGADIGGGVTAHAHLVDTVRADAPTFYIIVINIVIIICAVAASPVTLAIAILLIIVVAIDVQQIVAVIVGNSDAVHRPILFFPHVEKRKQGVVIVFSQTCAVGSRRPAS
jgi:hypothetical protein